MLEIQVADDSVGPFNTAATLIGAAAVVGTAYLCDRIYRRWLSENHPLAEHRARLARLRTGYQEKRANVSEMAQVIGYLLVEVAGATSTGIAR
jgi:hypothetical protein